MFVYFKQKTAYEMRISDWSSDVCSSDLARSGDRRIRKLQACRGVARRQRTHLHAVDVGRPACGIEGRLPVEGMGGGAMVMQLFMPRHRQIGRASCRERGDQYV